MKDWVKRGLDRIDALFPPDRIQASKARWRKMWSGNRPIDRYPFLLGFPHFNPYNAHFGPEERLRAYLEVLPFAGQFGDDLIPSFFPGLNNGSIPSMFGAPLVQAGIETTCERIISAVGDAAKLPEGELIPGTPAAQWVEVCHYVAGETDGRLPVHVCDMQGPVDVAGQLWGYDGLFLTAYDAPEVYHELLAKIARAFIRLWKAQEDAAGDLFVGTHLFSWDWVPPGTGASLSADSMVMISPEFFDSFFRPTMEQIGEELGGLSVHSCGDFRAVVPNLCRVPGVKAVNASQLSVRSLLEAGLADDTVVIAIVGVDELQENMEEIRGHDLGACLTVSGVWPTDSESGWKHPDRWSAEDRRDVERKVEKVARIMAGA